MNPNLVALLYLVAGVLFILALRGLSNPETSRRGNAFGMTGMVIAIVTTLASHPPGGIGAWVLVIVGLGIGGSIGAITARRVPMTAMPELVAAFHSLVGMAAVLVAAGALYAPAAFDIGTVGNIHGASLIEMSLGVAIGAITFTGSVIAFLKLSARMSGKPITLPAPPPSAIPRPTRIHAPSPTGGCAASVVATAIAIPAMPHRLPRRLVSGLDSPRNARMKSTPATR